MNEPRITKDIPNRRLTIEKTFAAPLSKVWRAWTTEERLVRWWGPQEWPADTQSFNFVEGGRWHFRMTGPQGDQVWILLHFNRIQPMASLVMEDYNSDPQGNAVEQNPNSQWQVSFKKHSAQSTEVIVQVSFATEAALEQTLERGFEAGFTSALSNLDTLLVGRSIPQTLVSKDGTKIVYEKLGHGPALILVSGAMVTRDFSGNTALAGLLAGRFTVYNYDRRGRGDSSDTSPYSVEREIEDLAALIEVAGGSAAVYGMSSGAILALHAAAHGLNITLLILYEPPFIVDAADRHPPSDCLAVVSQMIAKGHRGAAVSYFMTKIFGMPAFMPLLMRLSPYWAPSLAVANTIPYDLTITGDFSIPAKFSAVQTPSLVLYGEKTQALLIHGALALANILRNATLKTLPGQSHDVDPAMVAPLVEEFAHQRRLW